jgi:diguanylate cyclase (GGDEF)-like protein
MWAAVPYRKEISSRVMFVTLGTTNTLYTALITFSPDAGWTLNIAAALLGASPLLIALWVLKKFNRSLRWVVVSLYCSLSIFALLVQRLPGGGELAMNGILFAVYFGCCVHFWYGYRRATTGAFITIAGFLTWSAVFVIGPIMQVNFPAVHIEGEVWNLPKFVVAVGMILLLLEDQIEHNRHLALHDPLTGLPNRRLFQDRLAIALERARRTESQTALLVVDLDRFKQVNDTLGHHAGDLVLQQVATKFSARVRRCDTVARTGGDEFSVILEEPTNRDQAILVGRSLQKILDEPMPLDNEQFARVGASVGIAVFPEDAHDMESLCIAADRRMYEFKNVSRDPVVGQMSFPPNSPSSQPPPKRQATVGVVD